MPNYYFALFRAPADGEAHHFADDSAAKAEAVLCARELARNREPHLQERVIVTRQDGTVVHQVFLKDCIPR